MTAIIDIFAREILDTRQSEGNTLEISLAVQDAVEELRETLPEGVELVVTSDDGIFIEGALTEVVKSIGLATGIVILVILAFLRSFRATLIPAITIPVALIGTVAAIWLTGFSINTISLLALVLATGMVVDDSIVVVENIVRKRKEGMGAFAAAAAGTNEVFFAVISTTATLAAVFIPISFLPGQAGGVFGEFGFVLAFAVTLSSIAALTLAPVLAALLDPGGHGETAGQAPGAPGRLSRGFDWAVDRAIRAPLLVLALAFGFALVAAGAAGTLASTITPTEDRGFFLVQARGASDTTAEYLDGQVAQIEEILAPFQERGQITSVQSIIGIGGGTTAFIVARLPDWSDRDWSQQELMRPINGMLSRVGDEHMGRFIREQLVREGVDVQGVATDPERLTALVILGIRDEDRFPLIFYRENCADMALSEGDIDEDFIAKARCVLATGTHLSHPQTEAAVMRALELAKKHGAQTALDIDYRPNLWGVAGHGEGESRFVESAAVTTKQQATLHLFDLIVGTEEEFHIAGGTTDTLAALRAVRAVSDATLVCKRGAAGAVAFEGEIAGWDSGQQGPGFPIEVFNVLGAGDGFFSGLLKGWLDSEPWPKALEYANACGAFAVSRHGCTPAYPSLEELRFFLSRGVKRPDLRNDAELEQIHWATNRQGRMGGDWSTMRVFAFDHRMQLEQMEGYTPQKGGAFKRLCLEAALKVQDGQGGYGILCDGRIGREALHAASGTGLWIGRPAEWPGSRPLELEPELGRDCGGLGEWARENVVKVLCFCHPDDDAALRAEQEATVRRLYAAARRSGLEFLLEIIPSKVGAVDDETTATLIRQFYAAGIYPDWWKLEPLTSRAAWAKAIQAIEEHDRHTRGIVVLGLDAPEAELAASFEVAAGFDLVRGFAVGRTIFGQVARDWLAGQMDDAKAVAAMADRYRRLCGIWDNARAAAMVAA